MTLFAVKEILGARVHACESELEREVESGCAADLMSDVLAFGVEHGILLTGLINPQVIRTAEMMDMRCVVFLRGKEPTAEIIKLAEEKDIVLLSTDVHMYDACGVLYGSGLNNGGA